MAVYKIFISRAVENALNQFMLRDIYLLKENVNERAITHKIGEYLQNEFGSFYSVDCEFNRNYINHGSSKKINIIECELKKLVEDKSSVELINDIAYREISVYPDIIVHKRGKNKNLLIIEVKKSNNHVGSNLDILKLKAYTDPSESNNLYYEYGLFIDLDMITYTNHKLIWFKAGKKIKEL